MIKGTDVIVTTQYRGVYQGTINSFNKGKREIVLNKANMVIRWGTTNGVDQLAKTGPTADSKIADMAPQVWLCGITSVVVCTKKAVKEWEKHKNG